MLCPLTAGTEGENPVYNKTSPLPTLKNCYSNYEVTLTAWIKAKAVTENSNSDHLSEIISV